jgi:hypothetical protein
MFEICRVKHRVIGPRDQRPPAWINFNARAAYIACHGDPSPAHGCKGQGLAIPEFSKHFGHMPRISGRDRGM